MIGRDEWLGAAGRARLVWRHLHNGISGQRTTLWSTMICIPLSATDSRPRKRMRQLWQDLQADRLTADEAFDVAWRVLGSS